MTAEPNFHPTNNAYVPLILTTPMFRWSGEYFGFLESGALFAADGTYLGWIDDGAVWNKDGTFRGRVVEQNYILKREMKLEPLARKPRTPPRTPVPPFPSIRRPARILERGCLDALDAH